MYSFTQILKWKIYYRNSMEDFKRQNKKKTSEIQDSVFEMIQSEDWKEKKNEEKWIEAKGLKGHHQQHKNIQSLSCRRRGDWGMGRKKK